MKKNSNIYIFIISICFLYTGSAYMSQFYRLIDFFDETKVDLITSAYNYLFQALGIGLYMFGLTKSSKIFGNKKSFIVLLITGSIFMLISQMSLNGNIIVLAGYIFNLHIGLYFGFYLTFFSKFYHLNKSGIGFALAYAFGSLGTYFLSLIDDGKFLTSSGITALYFVMVAIIIALVLLSKNIETNLSLIKQDFYEANLNYLIPIVSLMCVISVLGSQLYYSIPIAENINWNVIRTFYAFGLIFTGYIIDKKRFIGEILVVSSLIYPLISTSLIGEKVANTTILSLSYFFRGFLTIYYIISFTSLKEKDERYIVFASLGLFISRIIEVILTIFLFKIKVLELYQLLFSAICFIPLLMLFVQMQNKKYSLPLSTEKKLAGFAQRYELTSREIDIVHCLADGLSDNEISQKLFISKNTVRFHISNVLKKTECDSRIDIVNLYNRM